MARTPMITRTLKTYNAKAIVFADADNTTVEMDITTTLDSDKARQKALPEGFKLIKTLAVTTEEHLVGMTVTEFMEHAKPVTRTTKATEKE